LLAIIQAGVRPENGELLFSRKKTQHHRDTRKSQATSRRFYTTGKARLLHVDSTHVSTKAKVFSGCPRPRDHNMIWYRYPVVRLDTKPTVNRLRVWRREALVGSLETVRLACLPVHIIHVEVVVVVGEERGIARMR
jgi:hypothetical protein